MGGTWQKAALSIDRLRLPKPAVRCGYHDQGRNRACCKFRRRARTPRDKLLEEHGIADHARRATKVVMAVDSAGCANVLCQKMVPVRAKVRQRHPPSRKSSGVYENYM